MTGDHASRAVCPDHHTSLGFTLLARFTEVESCLASDSSTGVMPYLYTRLCSKLEQFTIERTAVENNRSHFLGEDLSLFSCWRMDNHSADFP